MQVEVVSMRGHGDVFIRGKNNKAFSEKEMEWGKQRLGRSQHGTSTIALVLSCDALI
jgi:hypothetical protein